MKHFCTIPVDLKIDHENKPYYVNCGELATHKVVDSSWYICEGHVKYAQDSKWELEKLKEA